MNFRVLLCTAILASSVALGQGPVDKNVPYGMYSGLALLMDIHHPVSANRMALIV